MKDCVAIDVFTLLSSTLAKMLEAVTQGRALRFSQSVGASIMSRRIRTD